MIFKTNQKGMEIIPENWEEEQVFSLFVAAFANGECTIKLCNWKEKPIYEISNNKTKFIGDNNER